MAFAAGSRVTAARLNRLQPTQYFVVGTGVLAGPVTNGDVPGASITFTTTTANATYSAVAVWDCDGTAAQTGTGTARIAVDGGAASPIATYNTTDANGRFDVSETYQGTLATAGTHTIKLIASPLTGQQIQGTNSSLLITITEIP